MAVLVVAMVITAVLLIAFLYSKSTYYGRIFSDGHYHEVGNWLCSALKMGEVRQSSLDDHTILQSSAECGFVFTREIDERDTIHISISQVGNPTTHAVSERFAYLILQILNQNHAEARLFYTETGIHHVVLSKETAGDWLTNEVGSMVSNMSAFQHLHFQFASAQHHPDS